MMVVINNISSPQKLMDLAKVVYSNSKNDVLVVTRPSGMAAQVGIPEVSKQAYRMKKAIIVLPSLQDLLEVIKPSKILILVPEGFAGSKDLCELITEDSAVVISGNEDGFSKSELGLGDKVFLEGVREYLPPAAMASALYMYVRLKCRLGNE